MEPTYTEEERQAINAEFEKYVAPIPHPFIRNHIHRSTNLFRKMLTLGEMYGRMYNSTILTKEMLVEVDGEMVTYEILGMKNLIKCIAVNMKGSDPAFDDRCLVMDRDSPWIPKNKN